MVKGVLDEGNGENQRKGDRRALKISEGKRKSEGREKEREGRK